jgi:hypothetical protein
MCWAEEATWTEEEHLQDEEVSAIWTEDVPLHSGWRDLFLTWAKEVFASCAGPKRILRVGPKVWRNLGLWLAAAIYAEDEAEEWECTEAQNERMFVEPLQWNVESKRWFSSSDLFSEASDWRRDLGRDDDLRMLISSEKKAFGIRSWPKKKAPSGPDLHEEQAFGTWEYIFECLWCEGTKHGGRQKCGGENRVLVVRGIVVWGIVVQGNRTRRKGLRDLGIYLRVNMVGARNVGVKSECLWYEGTKHSGRQKCGGENQVLVVRGNETRRKGLWDMEIYLWVLVVRWNETRWAPEMWGWKPSACGARDCGAREEMWGWKPSAYGARDCGARERNTVGARNAGAKTVSLRVSLRGVNTHKRRCGKILRRKKDKWGGSPLSQPPWVVYIGKGRDGILSPSPWWVQSLHLSP